MIQRWKHYLRQQISVLKKDQQANCSWAPLVEEWLDSEHIVSTAAYFQDEMLFADFHLHQSNAALDEEWKEQLRSRMREPTATAQGGMQQVYDYLKDMQVMDDMGQQRGTMKGMIFQNPRRFKNAADNIAAAGRSVTRASLVPLAMNMDIRNAEVTSISVKEGPALLPLLGDLQRKSDDNSPSRHGSFTNRLGVYPHVDSVDARVTLLKIRQKATVLKDVHDNAANDSGVSDTENLIFKRISLMLERHLTAEENPFKALLSKFQKYLMNEYKSAMDHAHALDADDSEPDYSEFSRKTEALCGDVKLFTKILVRCLILFYSFDICFFRVVDRDTKRPQYLPCTILNFDNLINFTTAIMFPRPVCRLVLDYFRLLNREKNERLRESLRRHQSSISMKSLEISEHFQLKRGLKLTAEEIHRAQNSYSQVFKPEDFDVETGNETDEGLGIPISSDSRDGQNNSSPSRLNSVALTKLSVTSSKSKRAASREDNDAKSSRRYVNSVKEPNYTEDEVLENTKNDPYFQAIKTLRYLHEVESPLEMMKVLLLVVRKIVKAINEFYKDSNGKQEVLTGDQIMALIIYVTLRAQVPEMFAYLDYLNNFLPENMKSAFSGYYLTVFNAACEYIADYKPPQ